MSRAISQLLSLRRRREQQAETQLQQTLRRQREQAQELARLQHRQGEVRVEVAQRIASLYQSSVDGKLGPGHLDNLVAAVDEQYRIDADMHATVETAVAQLAVIDEEVVQARGVLQERTRAVQKLEQMLDDIQKKANQVAEGIAEDEAERPSAGLAAAEPLGMPSL